MAALLDSHTTANLSPREDRVVDVDYSEHPSMTVVYSPVQERSTRDASERAEAVIRSVVQRYRRGVLESHRQRLDAVGDPEDAPRA